MTFTHGVGVGWLAPSLPLLGSGNTPLESPVTIDQASWVGSLIGLGALTGNIIFGLLLDRLGRKLCMYFLAIPNIVCTFAFVLSCHIFEGFPFVTQLCYILDILDSYLYGSRCDVSVRRQISSRSGWWRLLCGTAHIHC